MKISVEAVEVRHYSQPVETFEMIGQRKVLDKPVSGWKSEPDGPFNFLTVGRGGEAGVVLNPRTQVIYAGEIDKNIFRVKYSVCVTEKDYPLLMLRAPGTAFLGLRQKIEYEHYMAEIIRAEAEVQEKRIKQGP